MGREISEIFCAVGLAIIILKFLPFIGLPIPTEIFLTAVGASVIGFVQALETRSFYSNLPIMIITEDNIQKLTVEAQGKGLTLTEAIWNKISVLKGKPFDSEKEFSNAIEPVDDRIKKMIAEHATVYRWKIGDTTYHRGDCPIAKDIGINELTVGSKPSGLKPHTCVSEKNNLPAFMLCDSGILRLESEAQENHKITISEESRNKILSLRNKPFTDQEAWKEMLDSKFIDSRYDRLKNLLTEYAKIYVWQTDDPLYHEQNCPIAALINTDKQQSGNKPSGKTPHNFCVRSNEAKSSN
ncbi:MAG: hypothetical protein AB7P14_14080 [Blastocatellales bacterium]